MTTDTPNLDAKLSHLVERQNDQSLAIEENRRLNRALQDSIDALNRTVQIMNARLTNTMAYETKRDPKRAN